MAPIRGENSGGLGSCRAAIRGLLDRGGLSGFSGMRGRPWLFTGRTSVGLEVHARCVVAHALDVQSGENFFKARLCPDPAEVTGWVRALPGPSAVIYEVGPTGDGLARPLLGNDLRTVVAAPSKPSATMREPGAERRDRRRTPI